MSSSFRILFTAFLVAGATVPAAHAAAPATLDFTILRNGDEVGRHTVKFQNNADGLKVTVDTAVVVTVFSIPVYRFEHHGEELWRNAALAALSSNTNDDGTHHRLNVAADPSGLAVTGDDKPSRLSLSTLPASLWNAATVRQAALMNTLDGHVMTVSVKDLGEDTVAVHGQPRAAHHYTLSGDLSRELWYDADGTLVQVRFKAKDDSDLRYVLK